MDKAELLRVFLELLYDGYTGDNDLPNKLMEALVDDGELEEYVLSKISSSIENRELPTMDDVNERLGEFVELVDLESTIRNNVDPDNFCFVQELKESNENLRVAVELLEEGANSLEERLEALEAGRSGDDGLELPTPDQVVANLTASWPGDGKTWVVYLIVEESSWDVVVKEPTVGAPTNCRYAVDIVSDDTDFATLAKRLLAQIRY